MIENFWYGNARDSVESAQWWMLFAIMVANKPAERTRDKLMLFLDMGDTPVTEPFEVLNLVDIGKKVRATRCGQYRRIISAFAYIRDMTEYDPRAWDLDTLEAIPGVGPKTARWFYQLVNPEAPVAALDTHVLKFLRDLGHDAPKVTPAKGRTYRRLEMAFVNAAP